MTEDTSSEMPEEIWVDPSNHENICFDAGGFTRANFQKYTRTDLHTATVERLARAEDLIQKLRKSLARLEQKSAWIASRLDLYPDDLAEAFEQANKTLAMVFEYEGRKAG